MCAVANVLGFFTIPIGITEIHLMQLPIILTGLALGPWTGGLVRKHILVLTVHEAKTWYTDQKIQRILAALKKNGFQTFFASTRAEALDKVLSLIPSNADVGVGGSVTLREINLIEALAARGHTVFQHLL